MPPRRVCTFQLAFPADLDPVVWGTETSMSAEASPLRTPPLRTEEDGVRLFTWSTASPGLHARAEAEAAVDQLFASLDPIGQVHSFAKGMGIAAPQLGIDRAAAVAQPAEPGAPALVLLTRASSTARPRATSSTRAAFRSSTSGAWSRAR